jgi:DNA-binding phage protein
MNMLTKSYRDSLLESLQDPAEAAAYLDAALEDEDSRVSLPKTRSGFKKIVNNVRLTVNTQPCC